MTSTATRLIVRGIIIFLFCQQISYAQDFDKIQTGILNLAAIKEYVNFKKSSDSTLSWISTRKDVITAEEYWALYNAYNTSKDLFDDYVNEVLSSITQLNEMDELSKKSLGKYLTDKVDKAFYNKLLKAKNEYEVGYLQLFNKTVEHHSQNDFEPFTVTGLILKIGIPLANYLYDAITSGGWKLNGENIQPLIGLLVDQVKPPLQFSVWEDKISWKPKTGNPLAASVAGSIRSAYSVSADPLFKNIKGTLKVIITNQDGKAMSFTSNNAGLLTSNDTYGADTYIRISTQTQQFIYFLNYSSNTKAWMFYGNLPQSGQKASAFDEEIDPYAGLKNKDSLNLATYPLKTGSSYHLSGNSNDVTVFFISRNPFVQAVLDKIKQSLLLTKPEDLRMDQVTAVLGSVGLSTVNDYSGLKVNDGIIAFDFPDAQSNVLPLIMIIKK